MVDVKEMRKRALELAKKRTKQSLYKRDKLVVEAIEAVDELDSVANLLAERVKSWYAYHFPELERLVTNMETYLAIIKELKSRKYMEIAKLAVFTGRADKISNIAKQSIGADIPDKDLDQIAKLANMAIDVKKTREELIGYIEETTKEICPNLTYLVGPNLAARLISHAGSLEKLAELPASTIQVLGAEKALFAHLRKKSKPPKHGVIFLYPAVKNAPRHLRGKVARALATKISLAARIDYFSKGKDFQGEKLKKELDARIEEIMKLKDKPRRKPKQERRAKKKGRRR